MKLEMTLRERPGFLHAVPLFNLFALLLVLLSLSPALVQQAGISVELPPSQFQMERFSDTLVVTLAAGPASPLLYLGREQISRQALGQRLDKLRENGATPKTCILLQVDASVAVSVEREISEFLLAKGFRVALVGHPASLPESLAPHRNPGK